MPVHGQNVNLPVIGHLGYDSVTLAGCWHYVDKEGNEYALVGTSNGLSIVNLNEPTAPYEAFHVPGLNSNWREVKTHGDYAYVCTEAAMSGITIVNLSHLPDSINYRTWTGDAQHPEAVLTAHTIATADGFLYIFGSKPLSDGAIICSLSDPWNPEITGIYAQRYVHDGYIRNDTLWAGEIYAGQCSVIDVRDKSAPVVMATQPTPAAFNHNTWLSDDSRTLFTTDERPWAPLAAYDISDLNNITLLDTYRPSLYSEKEVHNVRVLRDFLVNPSYGGQLTIVDAHKPDNLVEVAFALLGTSLVWDADPYLPSGTLFATVKNEGLFIFKPDYARAAYLEGVVLDSLSLQPIARATVRILNTQVLDSTNVQGQFKTGYHAQGFYTVEVSAPGYYPRLLEFVELKAGHIKELEVYLQPDLSSTPIQYGAVAYKVYPTLFSSGFTIDARGLPPGQYRFELSDLQGRLIYSAALAREKTEISLGSILHAGTYLLTIKNQRGVVGIERLIKG